MAKTKIRLRSFKQFKQVVANKKLNIQFRNRAFTLLNDNQ